MSQELLARVPPGTPLVAERLTDPQLAWRIQLSYWERYGELAALPLPEAQGFFSLGGAQSVSQLALPPLAGGLSQRLRPLREWTDPRRLTDHWIKLCARLLCLGWVGPAYGPQRLGSAGGLMEVAGLYRIEECEHFVEARQAIEQTLVELARGLETFLLGENHPFVLEAARLHAAEVCRREAEAGHLLPPPLARTVLFRTCYDRVADEWRL